MCDPEDTRTLFQHRNTVIYVGKSDTLKNMNPPIPENEGFLKEEMDGEYGFLFSPGSNGEMVYAGVYETNGLGVLEVKLKSEIESFDTFKSSFKAAPKTLLSPEDIDLQTLSDDHIVIHTEGITVNNHSIPLADWPRYDAPWIHADWMHQSEDAGKITIGTPEQGLLTLDFRTPDRRVYIQNAIH
jgi:hypothetical protein